MGLVATTPVTFKVTTEAAQVIPDKTFYTFRVPRSQPMTIQMDLRMRYRRWASVDRSVGEFRRTPRSVDAVGRTWRPLDTE